MSVGIFLYGTAVFALVCTALGLIAWGIVNERRDRVRFEQGRNVFGEPAAALESAASQDAQAH